MRRAYLDLLKLSLCDLVGTGTGSVGRDHDGVVASRELRGDQLSLRAAGMDWPLHGLTMVGLNRLDDLQSCIESVVGDGVEGDLIEAGAWRGGASILMRATLDSLGDEGRTVWVADSFQGFPMPDGAQRDNDQWSIIDYLEVPLEEVKANFARFGCEGGVRFVPGFFEETMRGLVDRRWSIVRLDGDTYDATALTLRSLYPGLSVGGFLVVDDYGALAESRRAVDEFRDRHGLTEPLEAVDWTCVRWRKDSATPIEEVSFPGAGTKPGGASAARAITRLREAAVPTFREVELTRQIAALEERLAATNAEIAWLRGSPLRAPKAWVQRKLSR
jgi:O-methyltransferase